MLHLALNVERVVIWGARSCHSLPPVRASVYIRTEEELLLQRWCSGSGFEVLNGWWFRTLENWVIMMCYLCHVLRILPTLISRTALMALVGVLVTNSDEKHKTVYSMCCFLWHNFMNIFAVLLATGCYYHVWRISFSAGNLREILQPIMRVTPKNTDIWRKRCLDALVACMRLTSRTDLV